MKTYNFLLNKESLDGVLLQPMKMHCDVLSRDASFIDEKERKTEEERQNRSSVLSLHKYSTRRKLNLQCLENFSLSRFPLFVIGIYHKEIKQ
jgi:hypothetical protein